MSLTAGIILHIGIALEPELSPRHPMRWGMNQCKDCKFWGYAERIDDPSRKWDVWPYNECRALQIPLDDKKNKAIRCDTFHHDDHSVSTIVAALGIGNAAV
jgi:hypothetical protein